MYSPSVRSTLLKTLFIICNLVFDEGGVGLMHVGFDFDNPLELWRGNPIIINQSIGQSTSQCSLSFSRAFHFRRHILDQTSPEQGLPGCSPTTTSIVLFCVLLLHSLPSVSYCDTITRNLRCKAPPSWNPPPRSPTLSDDPVVPTYSRLLGSHFQLQVSVQYFESLLTSLP